MLTRRARDWQMRAGEPAAEQAIHGSHIVDADRRIFANYYVRTARARRAARGAGGAYMLFAKQRFLERVPLCRCTARRC